MKKTLQIIALMLAVCPLSQAAAGASNSCVDTCGQVHTNDAPPNEYLPQHWNFTPLVPDQSR
jgi:hypothetical protein